MTDTLVRITLVDTSSGVAVRYDNKQGKTKVKDQAPVYRDILLNLTFK